MMMCENFISCCEKAIEDKADAVESIRISEELKTRAEELKEKPVQELNELPNIQFQPSDLDDGTHTHLLHNIFGNIQGKL